jgi:transposase
MGKTFRPYQPDQLLVLPPSLQEWLPVDHLAYFVSDVVEGLDLSAIYESYTEERGYPPYHPLLMTKLWLYGYACGVRSSRKLQRATREDVAFRVLCAGNEPDFRTLSEFRRRHLEALGGLFAQVLQLCREAGLVKLGHVAIDGTKVKANASKHKAMSYERMVAEAARLKAEIERWFSEVEVNDRAEDERYGPDKTGDELPEELRHREGRLKKLAEAKAALEECARQAAEESGEGDGEVKPKAQRNFTDPESRIMLSSDGAFIQAYNAQLAVDAERQVIVAADVVQAANDKRELIPMVEAAVDAFEEVPKAFSADAGFWSEENAETLEHYEIEAYVAPEKIGHRQWREAKAPKGRVPKGLSQKERMRRKLTTKRGRAEYDKRKITVEPVCGQLRTVQGLDQFLLRGLEKVTGEWLLACTSHNLLKLFRNRDRSVGTNFGVGNRPAIGLAAG